MKFFTPHAYPAFLMALLREMHDVGDASDAASSDFDSLLTKYGKKWRGDSAWPRVYRAAMKDWRRLHASPYVFAARGLSGLSYDLIGRMDRIVAPPRGEFGYGGEMPVTMNVAVAAGFAAPGLVGDPERGGPVGMSVLVTYKLPPGNVRSHGGDSESGPLNEAELRVTKCGQCVDRIFIGGQRAMLPPRIEPPTDQERRLYCLSMYLKATRPTAWDAIRLPMAFAKDLAAWSRGSGYRVKTIRTPSEHARAERRGVVTVPADWGWWRYR